MKRGPFHQRPGEGGSTLGVHLTDAIALNRARQPFYAKQTGGRSRRLSRWLIGLERALLPGAWMVDRWAACYHRVGVPVVENDLVSMEQVRPAEAPPRYTARMSRPQRRNVAGRLRTWRARVLRHLLADDLEGVCQATEAVLAALARWETRWQVHLTMSRHLAESAGYAALHGLGYARRSGGRTLRLTKTLVLGHAALAPLAARLDREAQRSHRWGAGLLVNDVPAIPFLRELKVRRARKRSWKG